MKCKNLKVFKQLLNKGVSPLCMNCDGMTAVHYAIELERVEYLTYLFEGEPLKSPEDLSAVFSKTGLEGSPFKKKIIEKNIQTVETYL